MKKQVFVNLDADESIYFSNELEHVKAKTYDVVYPELKARMVIPVSFEAHPGAETISYQQFDAVGVAKIIANYATDLPRVDLLGKKFTANVRSLGDSYGYSVQDIRAARMAGKSLETRKANAAKRAIMALEDLIAAQGDSDHGLVGFVNHPNITDVAIPADGTGSSALWSAKTPDLILRDVNLLVSEVHDATQGAESPNTLILPHKQYTDIKTRRLTDTSMTIHDFLLNSSEYITEIMPWHRLKAAGAGSTDQMMVYDKNPDKITMEVPQDFEQFPVQERGLEYVVPCHARFGGVILYYPLSCAKGDGI